MAVAICSRSEVARFGGILLSLTSSWTATLKHLPPCSREVSARDGIRLEGPANRAVQVQLIGVDQGPPFSDVALGGSCVEIDRLLRSVPSRSLRMFYSISTKYTAGEHATRTEHTVPQVVHKWSTSDSATLLRLTKYLLQFFISWSDICFNWGSEIKAAIAVSACRHSSAPRNVGFNGLITLPEGTFQDLTALEDL